MNAKIVSLKNSVINKTNAVLAKTKNAFRNFDWRSYFLPNKKMIALIPYILIASLLIIAPMIMLLVKATSHIDGVDNMGMMTPSTWKIMRRSVYLGLAAAAISLLLSFPFAYTVARSKSKAFRMVSVALIVSPLLVFTISRVFSLKILLLKMFDNYSGLQNSYVMIAGMVYLYMPFMVVPLYSVLQQMPNSLLEASKDLGYGKVASIIKVVIPYTLKAIFSGIAVVFMMSATSLAITGSLLNGDTKHEMIGNYIAESQAKMAAGIPDTVIQGSVLALITIGIMFSVYIIIYAIPLIISKIKGGVNA